MIANGFAMKFNRTIDDSLAGSNSRACRPIPNRTSSLNRAVHVRERAWEICQSIPMTPRLVVADH